MTTLSMKSRILESGGSAGSTGSRGNGVSRVRADPPPTRAGGQDDGSYTNSLKPLFIFLVVIPSPSEGQPGWEHLAPGWEHLARGFGLRDAFHRVPRSSLMQSPVVP